MIFYLAQNPHCIIKTFLARLLLLCLLLFTSPYLPGRGGFVRLAAYRTSAAIQNISREQRQGHHLEPHSSFPFKPAARDKTLHWPRLKECQRQHLTMGLGWVVSVSVWTGSLAPLGKNFITSSADSKRFGLKVKQSRPCPECSQCLSMLFFFFVLIIIWLLEFWQSTLAQKYRNKGLDVRS